MGHPSNSLSEAQKDLVDADSAPQVTLESLLASGQILPDPDLQLADFDLTIPDIVEPQAELLMFALPHHQVAGSCESLCPRSS